MIIPAAPSGRPADRPRGCPGSRWTTGRGRSPPAERQASDWSELAPPWFQTTRSVAASACNEGGFRTDRRPDEACEANPRRIAVAGSGERRERRAGPPPSGGRSAASAAQRRRASAPTRRSARAVRRVVLPTALAARSRSPSPLLPFARFSSNQSKKNPDTGVFATSVSRSGALRFPWERGPGVVGGIGGELRDTGVASYNVRVEGSDIEIEMP